MAKRFTDTTKWENDWFLNLDPMYKMIWMYLLDKCDHAGIYTPSPRVEELCLGNQICFFSLEEVFGNRIKRLKNGRYILVKFVEYQYGVTIDKLNIKNNCHKSAISLLKKEGLISPCGGVKDKDKDKDKGINTNIHNSINTDSQSLISNNDNDNINNRREWSESEKEMLNESWRKIYGENARYI